MGIIDSTSTLPLVVFCYAPNVDQQEGLNHEMILERLARAQGDESAPSRGRLLQPVFRYGPGSVVSAEFESSEFLPRRFLVPNGPPPGAATESRRGSEQDAADLAWTLEPYYDPTNGTCSRGDLFVVIPKPE